MKTINAERNIRFQQLKASGGSANSDFQKELLIYSDLKSIIYPYYLFASRLDYNHPGLDSQVYFSHPLRVATICLKEDLSPTPELIITALNHNIKELSHESFKDLSKIANKSIMDGINILTINRKLVNNKSYLDEYYSNIMSANAFVGKVKIFDKLDNLFMLCLNRDKYIRDKYLEEINEYVLPLVDLLTPTLYEYFTLLTNDCNSIGYYNPF